LGVIEAVLPVTFGVLRKKAFLFLITEAYYYHYSKLQKADFTAADSCVNHPVDCNVVGVF